MEFVKMRPDVNAIMGTYGIIKHHRLIKHVIIR